MKPTHIVRYEGRIENPDGKPSETGGPPHGQGPPEDAAPSNAVANILEKTPAMDDDRLEGVGTDGEGNPQGRPPREYTVEDTIDEDTGHRVVRGMLPVTAQADAEALLQDIGADLADMDTHEARAYKSPTGGVTTEAVREYYEAHPDEQPVDEDGEPYIPSTWDPERHIVDEV